MKNCLNCNALIPDSDDFCDDLCSHGYKEQAYRKLFKKEDNDESLL